MMIKKIQAVLAATSGIADWKIIETRRIGSELFLVGKQVDMARNVETTGYSLIVYVDSDVDGKKTRGDSAVTVHPTMTASELTATIKRAAFAASRSKNPWFPLPEPAAALTQIPGSGFADKQPSFWMSELREAFYEAEAPGNARINSLELFLARNEMRVCNSRGIDAAWSQHSGYAEFTVEADGSNGSVELTDDFRFSEPDAAKLSLEIANRLRMVADRAEAKPSPALSGLPLILTGNEAADALGWFFTNVSSQRSYTKSSPFVLGKSVHGDTAKAGEFDPIELRAEAALPGHPRSAPFDMDGVPLKPTQCITEGVLRGLVGPSRYASYLGLPQSGNFSLFSISPGSSPIAELRSKPHIEVAFFSDFNVDPDSGDFGGEIRLAYHFDGSKRQAIFGGSITGSLFENRGRIRLASELAMAGSMMGPVGILLPEVSITGAV